MSADPITLQVYAQEAARYEAFTVSDAEEAALDAFLARLDPGARILDLGCGPGHQAAAMLARGFDVVGWDASEAFVEAAQAKGVQAQLRGFDDLDACDAFDAVWASFSLLHAPKADFLRHLAAIATALRRPGHLYLALKTGEGERRDALGRFYAYYTEPELAQALTDAGFELLETVMGRSEGLAGTMDPFILIAARHG